MKAIVVDVICVLMSQIDDEGDYRTARNGAVFSIGQYGTCERAIIYGQPKKYSD